MVAYAVRQHILVMVSVMTITTTVAVTGIMATAVVIMAKVNNSVTALTVNV